MEHKCEICDSTENLKYFATSGCIERGDSKTYLSGGIYICDECLSICDECKTCGKTKASMLIEPFVNGLMESDFFCKCPETKEEKEERYKREEKRYNKLQEKKRYEKTIKGIQKHINERNAKTEENKINESRIEDIKNNICQSECGDCILDCIIANVFQVTTNEIRAITQENIEVFTKDDLYHFTEEETETLKDEIKKYQTSTPPYAYSIRGVFKLAFLLKNGKGKAFINSAIESVLKNNFFETNDKILQELYDSLTDSYIYRSIKEKQDADKNRLLQLEQEVKELKKENDEYYQKVFNLKTYLFLAVCAILFLIAMIFKS